MNDIAILPVGDDAFPTEEDILLPDTSAVSLIEVSEDLGQTISVIGTGYLGATHAAAMAHLGHTVIGVDTDSTKIAALREGIVPFYEPGLSELLVEQTTTGRLSFTIDYSETVKASIHFICVGTPQVLGSSAADTRFVFAAVDALLPHIPSGSLIVGKSTVPVGTAALLAARIREARGDEVRLVWNPEFLREGFAVADTLQPDRIVIGAEDKLHVEPLVSLYANALLQGTPLIVTDYPTAELVKMAANSFLATKISFINAMADVCDAAGANVSTLAEAIGWDERIGDKFLRAGVGFGGGCLPKDIRAFEARAEELGVGESLAFLREVDRVNMRRREQAVAAIVNLLNGDVLGANVAILGVAFKPDSDDVRDSPALNIAASLHLKGANVRVFDPQAIDNARKAFPTLPYVETVEEALAGTDVIAILTEWDEFIGFDPREIALLVEHCRVFDGRNVLSSDQWKNAGWEYRGVGRT